MSLITVPKKVYMDAVAAEGETELNAFDNCLIKAKLPHVSLIKVTSILPPNIELVNEIPKIPIGANVPSIYIYVHSSTPGETIAVAIALGWTNGGPALVAEFGAQGISKEEAEQEALKRLEGMAEARNLKIVRKHVVSVDHTVEKCGCVLGIVAEVA